MLDDDPGEGVRLAPDLECGSGVVVPGVAGASACYACTPGTYYGSTGVFYHTCDLPEECGYESGCRGASNDKIRGNGM